MTDYNYFCRGKENKGHKNISNMNNLDRGNL